MRFGIPIVPAVALLVAVAILVNLYVAVPRRGGDGELGSLAADADISADPAPKLDETAVASPSAQVGEVAVSGGPMASEVRRRAIDTQWERRSVPVVPLPDKAQVAIVIDDLGIDRAKAMRVIALPAPLTLSFLPYGRDAPALAILARQRGHEILLHMPMQAVGGENPGPQALTVDLAAVEIRARVGAALDRFGDAVGLNNHMGSRFTAERRLLIPVVEELASRGLIFVDSRTGPTSQGAHAAEEIGIPTASRDIFLDNDLSPDEIRKQLDELERVARRRGHAIAIGHPHETTMAVLSAWLPVTAERGIQIVPVSAIIRKAMERGHAPH